MYPGAAAHRPTQTRVQTPSIPSAGTSVQVTCRNDCIRLWCFHTACRQNIGRSDTVDRWKGLAENSCFVNGNVGGHRNLNQLDKGGPGGICRRCEELRVSNSIAEQNQTGRAVKLA